ncbi:MAG: tRNA-(ms[2]io[6]A)-hydroxylase [bacterium]|nr:tRNA-(ms[2]io[6]A)-hydroxylase [bacterium]
MPETASTNALAAPTPPEWAVRQRSDGCRAELLLDQAHLEKKAAAGATTFLFRVPYEATWQRGLSTLAREELVHYERTLRLLQRRDLTFAPQRQTGYAAGLKDGIGKDMPLRLVDELLVAAIIEARSCERMGLLAREFADVDRELADFYADLVEAEARHEELYRDIAVALTDAATVAERWQALTRHEASVLGALPWAPRLHSGVG